MAINIKPQKTSKNLFCASKWWGDPDMPIDMQYPTMKAIDEDGDEFEYPLTFICQINCEDIAELDKENKLPHEGMFYFFANIDEFLGYDTPSNMPKGEWEKGNISIKYTKSVNMETFHSVIMVDEDEECLTETAQEIIFSECEDDSKAGHRLLGLPLIPSDYPDHLNFFQLGSDDNIGLNFYNRGSLSILIKEKDLQYANYKKSIAYLNSL